MIKKSLEITPGIEPLYGTHDENLRILEDKLNVTIDLRSDAIHVTGEATNVARVEQVFIDFDTLRKSGINLHNGELHGMLKLVVADPATTLKSLVDAGKQRSDRRQLVTSDATVDNRLRTCVGVESPVPVVLDQRDRHRPIV